MTEEEKQITPEKPTKAKKTPPKKPYKTL